jgi:hypothetical protein
MSLLRRLSRALETGSSLQLDGRSLFGAQGEEYASKYLDGPMILSRVTNPIIPPSHQQRYHLESDFLVYAYGNLFCIEIKRYKGRITYAPREQQDGVAGRSWSYRFSPTRQGSSVGPTDAMILQEKTGKYGEPLPPRTHSNPLKKTKAFIRPLKTYLGDHVDERFRTLFIIAVAAFVEEADISTIHSLDAGMIYVHELPTFLQQHAHPRFAQTPSRWIAEGIQQIPTSDLVVTTDNQPFKGFIMDEALVFKKRDGGIEQIPYAAIRSVWLQRTWLFSDYDHMTIFFANGSFQEFECVSGSVQMNNFTGERQVHKLRNINKIVVGRANKVLQLG